MTASQFEEMWASRYALAPPISYLLRKAYPNRWFRIHSLPASKRYPVNDLEWSILFDRQNLLICDLLGNGSDNLIVTGEYDLGSNDKHDWTFSPAESIHQVAFTDLPPVSLETLNNDDSPDEYKAGDIYRPVFSELQWQPLVWNKLLMAVANDELSVFFISVTNELIIAPYDGGVDVILKNESTRNFYKAKYKDWLSAREDGL